MIYHGDCLEVLKTFEADSIDAIVTDPPAGISFMNKEWDKSHGFIPSMTRIFEECIRVLKPGAHGFVWALPRTSHWTATALEDAGFEIRDVVTHLFGSGFPKSMDISKAIDKQAGAEREVIGEYKRFDGKPAGLIKEMNGGSFSSNEDMPGKIAMITAPATDGAKQWQGWGTALKPASEHWVLVRKPLSQKTVAANVLLFGTGAINIDASRIHGGLLDSDKRMSKGAIPNGMVNYGGGMPIGGHAESVRHNPIGRFPANLILDEEAAQMLDEQSGVLISHGGGKASGKIFGGKLADIDQTAMTQFKGDSGGASRFFYVAKCSKSERNAGCEGLEEKDRPLAISQWKNQTNGSGEIMGPSQPQMNHHPTVKPKKLMSYLINMITPPVVFVCESCENRKHEIKKEACSFQKLSDLQDSIQTQGQSQAGQNMLKSLCNSSTEKNISTSMRTMQNSFSADERRRKEILQSELCNKGNGINSEVGEGDDRCEGLSNALHPRTSNGEQSGINNGTSSNNGEPFEESLTKERSSSSYQRNKERQQDRKSGIDVENATRQASEAQRSDDNFMSSLHEEDKIINPCPSCGKGRIKRPGTVLDPFAGSGSTGVAAIENGFQFIGIEKEKEYFEIAERRISHSAEQSRLAL